MAKRTVSLLLALLFCFAIAVLAACSDGKPEESNNNSAGDSTSDSVSEGPHFLPEARVWDKEITVLVYANDGHPFSTIIIPEELNNEPINDAFYNRNSRIERDYGIKLNLATCSTPAEGVEWLRNDYMTGTCNYNIASIPLTYIAPLGIEGLLYDIYEIDNGYIHYNEPWWDQAAIRDLTINNKLWFLAGDAIIEDDEATWAIYYNKDLVEKYNLEAPYDLVKSNQWNLDTFHEMAKKVFQMNGSTRSYDPSVGDVWGAVVQSYDCYAFMLGAGQPMVVLDDGTPRFRVQEEANVNTFYKVIDLMLDDQNVGVADFFGRWDSGVYGQESDIFCNGNALFMPSTISLVSGDKMRNAEIHYGIAPMPKANELQDEYTTSVSVYWCQVMVIPKANNDKDTLDATCYAMEAMAYYGKELVTPEYYTRTLTLKRFPDSDNTEMLDLIFRNRTYDLAGIFDFGTVNGNGAGSLYFYTSLLGAKSSDITSFWETKKDLFESAMADLMASVQGE